MQACRPSGCFNPHRLPEPVLPRASRRERGCSTFQSSPAPRAGATAWRSAVAEVRCMVSILTGSQSRCNLTSWRCKRRCRLVSILTGSREPVLRRSCRAGAAATLEFQSSPAPRAGATSATAASMRTHCFNPHRLSRAGATRQRCAEQTSGTCFNPHRLLRAGATDGDARRSATPRNVSILTGSESRCNQRTVCSRCRR